MDNAQVFDEQISGLMVALSESENTRIGYFACLVVGFIWERGATAGNGVGYVQGLRYLKIIPVEMLGEHLPKQVRAPNRGQGWKFKFVSYRHRAGEKCCVSKKNTHVFIH